MEAYYVVALAIHAKILHQHLKKSNTLILDKKKKLSMKASLDLNFAMQPYTTYLFQRAHH